MRSSFRKRLVLLVTILVALSIVSGFYLVSKSQVALSATLNEVNSWKEGNTHKTQYSISLTNPTQSAVNGWRIELSVPEGATIAEGGAWNAKFDIKGQVLTITPLDYNQSISAGGSASDIGFIIGTTKAPDNDISVISAVSDDATSSSTSPTTASQSTNQDPSQPAGETTGTSTPVTLIQGDDYLTTRGNQIVDQNGTQVWLTGVNWFGYNTGTNIFDGVWACNMQNALESIADRGFNLLRIPISAELLLAWKNNEYPQANFNQAYNSELVGMNSLGILDYAVQICGENGIKIMFDIHSAETDAMGHMTNLWYTDNISTEQFYEALAFLTTHFKDNDTVIAIDLKNEPHGKPHENGAIWNDSDDQNNWKHVAQEAGNIVLDINPNLLIMIEGIEIYPIDLAENSNYASQDASDYYFCWWGGNLRGVKDYPIDFGTPERNAQIVYSPHDYGPSVYAQPWFSKDFTFESLKADCWDDNWLYIYDSDTAPLLIGEWGGFMQGDNLKWMTLLRQLILDNQLHHTFWCFNANSGDTGGLVKDDFTTWDEDKYAFVKEVLWQQDGAFVGLDHEVPLGKAGNGIALSHISGSVDVKDQPETTVPETSAAEVSETTSVINESDTTSNSIANSEVGESIISTTKTDSPNAWFFVGIALAILLIGGGILVIINRNRIGKL